MGHIEALNDYFRCATSLTTATRAGASQQSKLLGRTLLELHENLVELEQQLVLPPSEKYDRVLRVVHRMVDPLDSYRQAKASRNTRLIVNRMQNNYVFNAVFHRERCLHAEGNLYTVLEHMIQDEEKREFVRYHIEELPPHLMLDIHLHLHDAMPLNELLDTLGAQRLLTETLARNYAAA